LEQLAWMGLKAVRETEWSARQLRARMWEG